MLKTVCLFLLLLRELQTCTQGGPDDVTICDSSRRGTAVECLLPSDGDNRKIKLSIKYQREIVGAWSIQNTKRVKYVSNYLSVIEVIYNVKII